MDGNTSLSKNICFKLMRYEVYRYIINAQSYKISMFLIKSKNSQVSFGFTFSITRTKLFSSHKVWQNSILLIWCKYRHNLLGENDGKYLLTE